MCCYLKLVVFLLTFVTIHFYCMSTFSLPISTISTISNQCQLIQCITGDGNLCNVQNKKHHYFCKSFSKTKGFPRDKIDRCCQERNKCYNRIRKCHFFAKIPRRFDYEWQCKLGNVGCISNKYISWSSSEMAFCHQPVCWCDRQYAMCLYEPKQQTKMAPALAPKPKFEHHRSRGSDPTNYVFLMPFCVFGAMFLFCCLLFSWPWICSIGRAIVDKYRRIKYIIRRQKEKLISWCKRTKKGRKRLIQDVKYTPEQKWIIAQEINRRQYVLNRVTETFDARETGWKQIGERIKVKGVPIKSYKHIREVTWQNMKKKATRHHRYQPNMMNELDRLIIKMIQDSEKHFRENVVLYLG